MNCNLSSGKTTLSFLLYNKEVTENFPKISKINAHSHVPVFLFLIGKMTLHAAKNTPRIPSE